MSPTDEVRIWQELRQRSLVLAIAIFFGATLILILHRHFTFYSDYDQGIFNQVFWNGLHGHFFQSSLSSQLSTNVIHAGEVPAVDYHRLGQHFTPALLLWLPVYALFPHSATLAVLQVCLITAAGVVAYFLAREYLEPPLAARITLSFYGANAILGPTLANFHDVSQVPLYAFSLLLAMERRCWWLFWVMAAALLAVREDSGVTLFGIGAYLVASRRYPKIGLVTCALSFGYVLLLTNVVMPLFSEDVARRFTLERFGQYVDGEEASTLDVLWGMLSQPTLLLSELVRPVDRTLGYLAGQLLPWGFVPVLSPASWAISGPPLLKLLLGSGRGVLSINIRYAISVVPGLCYGAILWWGGRGPLRFWQPAARVEPRSPKRSLQRFLTTCLCLSVVGTLAGSPNRTLYFAVPDSYQPWVHVSLVEQWQRLPGMRALLGQIPPDASVAATKYFIPHLSGRREIVRFPTIEVRNDGGQVERVEYVLLDLWRLEKYGVAFDRDLESLKAFVPQIEEMLASREYAVVGFEKGSILLQRNGAAKPEAAIAWQVYRDRLVSDWRIGYVPS